MLKNKKNVKFLMLLIGLVLSIVTPNVYALDIESNQANEIRSIAELKDEILVENVETNGLKKKQEIYNVDRFKSALKENHPEMSDYELGKTILMSLGDDAEFVYSLPEDKVIEALDYISVVTTESFLKEMPDGELIEISEELFYSIDTTQDIAKREEKVQTRALTLPNYSQTFGDIVLRSRAFKRASNSSLPGRDFFTIRGEAEWVGFPNFQMTDMLAIASTGNVDNNYSHYSTALWQHPLTKDIYDTAYFYSNNGKGTYISLSNPDTKGLAVKVPIGIGQQSQVLLTKVYAYYGVSSQSDITCQVSYAHAILAWSPSVSISSSGSISFGGLGVQRQVFNGYAFTLYHGVTYK